MNDINDKMCLFHLEYRWVKTIFDVYLTSVFYYNLAFVH